MTNIDVLRLEKLCVKVARAEQTCGNMYMHICEVLKNREGGTLELFLLNVACAMGWGIKHQGLYFKFVRYLGIEEH